MVGRAKHDYRGTRLEIDHDDIDDLSDVCTFSAVTRHRSG